MRQTATRHRTSTTVRLAGPHAVDVIRLRGTVRLYMPGLLVTIADRDAAESTWKVWGDAAEAFPKIFPTGDRAPNYRVADTDGRAYANIRFAGNLKGRDILGKTPKSSPSGCGELKVRLGCLIIVCDDLASAESQVAAWGEAYNLGIRQGWLL